MSSEIIVTADHTGLYDSADVELTDTPLCVRPPPPKTPANAGSFRLNGPRRIDRFNRSKRVGRSGTRLTISCLDTSSPLLRSHPLGQRPVVLHRHPRRHRIRSSFPPNYSGHRQIDLVRRVRPFLLNHPERLPLLVSLWQIPPARVAHMPLVPLVSAMLQ